MAERLAPHDETRIDLACFEVAGELYALEIGEVREIVRCRPTTRLPKAPALIEGVIDLRGSVIPVVDLGPALGLGPAARGPQARIVVAQCGDLVIGLRVSAAVDVLSVPAVSLEDAPALARETGYETIRAVVRREEAAPLMVLSLDHLLEGIHRSAVAGAGPAEPAPTAPQGEGA